MMNERSTCYCTTTRRVAGHVNDFYSKALEPSGITTRQYSLLQKIQEAEECCCRELSDMIGLDRTTLTRSLKPLIKEGLVTDEKSDGCRNCCLKLTDKGRKAVETAGPLWEQAQKAVEEVLQEDGLEALQLVLERLSSL